MFNWLPTLVSARCPICRFRWGDRARRLGDERILSWLGLYPFECRACNCRFYALWFYRK